MGLAELGTDTLPVQRTALAQHVGLGVATVGDCMAFLADLKLVEAGRGQYAITEQGRAFAEAWRRDRALARTVLHPLMQEHWSAAAAATHLAGGPLPQEELARRLRTGLPGVPMRGQYLVEWLEIAQIVERDPELLHVRLPASASGEPPPQETHTERRHKAGEETADTEEDPRPNTADAGEDPGADTADAGSAEADAAGAGAGGSRSAAVLLGMSRPEIQALPDARYTAFLEGILTTLRGALAPPS